MVHRRAGLLCCAALLTGLSTGGAAADADPERQLLTAFDQWQAGQVQEARKALDDLVRRVPNFRLAQLIYGELLAARSGTPVPGLLLGSGQPEVRDLVEEARLRLRQWRRPGAEGTVPDAIISLSPQTRYVVVVDLPEARLHVVENGPDGPRVVRNFYAAMGRNGSGKQVSGDNRTPVGVYRVTGFLRDEELPELYGAGAFPLDYPNALDQRRKKTGNGIWLHGVPRETYARAPRSSEGCVTMANSDLLDLKAFLKLERTPVVLSDRLVWRSPAERESLRSELAAQLEGWRQAWSARDTGRYLGYYADDFETDGMNKPAFSEYKRRVNSSKSFIEVQVSEVDLIGYPDAQPMVLARFRQNYRSDNFSKSTYKEQYWRRDGSRWRIIKEASS